MSRFVTIAIAALVLIFWAVVTFWIYAISAIVIFGYTPASSGNYKENWWILAGALLMFFVIAVVFTLNFVIKKASR